MVDHVRDASRPDFLSKPSLGGEQVLLRPVTADDMPALMPMLMDAETSRLTGSHDDGPLDERRIHAWYESRRQQDDRLDLAVVEPATGSIVARSRPWQPTDKLWPPTATRTADQD